MSAIIQHLNDYAMAILVTTVAVSTILRVLHLDATPIGQRILAVCFDVGGAIRGYQNARKDETPK